MYGYIYLTTNSINGKRYIGKHKSESFDTKYIGSGVCLRSAIIKYGKNNFVCECLCECETQDELNSKEIEYIERYDAVNSTDFYNIANGGEGGNTGNYQGAAERCRIMGLLNKGKVPSAKWRKEQSERMIGNNLNDFITTECRKMSREKAVATIRERGSLSKDNNPMFGKSPWNKGTPMSEEQKLKISKTRKEKNISSPTKGTIAVHKGRVTKYIKHCDLDVFLNAGYEIGGAPRVRNI